MPGRNQTGPMGMGPMTGRGAGICTGTPGRDSRMPRQDAALDWVSVVDAAWVAAVLGRGVVPAGREGCVWRL